MSSNKFERKQITKKINNVIQNGFSIDASRDEDLLKSSQYNWDDLNNLKADLGNQIIEFIAQVTMVITNPDVTNNLGEKTKQFEKTISLFFSDINNFSLKIHDIYTQHEKKSGYINNLNDFNQYNHITTQYLSLFSELVTLVSPTLADLMVTITDIIPVKVDEAVIISQEKRCH